MPDCIFCKIIAGEIQEDKIFEDDDLLAFLDINSVTKGHTLIIPKEHHAELNATPDELISKMMHLAKRIGMRMIAAGLAQGVNYFINNGKAAGQLVFHFHIHVIPRNENDGIKLWKGHPYAEGEAKEIASKLKI